MSDSIGLVETRGYAGSIEASDAMVKAASVSLVRTVQIGGGFVTVVVKGDVGSVKASVEAGAEAAKNNFPKHYIDDRHHARQGRKAVVHGIYSAARSIGCDR